jgi:predicted AlkP superfamily phosphohydrolase/phosphomutase
MFRGALDYISHARDFVAARMKAARHLIQNWEADVVMAVLTEADRVCHHYWHFSDRSHPLHPNQAPEEYRNAISGIFRVIDFELGRTLDILSDECSIVVVSDHGFGPGHSSLAAHTTLENAGLLHTTEAGDAMPGAASWFTENGKTVDWRKTKAYMPVPGSYGLNVNLKGRQVSGTVNPEDAPRVRKDIAAVFSEVRLPGSRKPAFSRILTRDEAFPGPNMERAPDLLLVPADESLMVTPSHGEEWTWSAQTGLHRHEGMWMHRSPRVKSGPLGHRVRLIDVLPTLFEDLGYECGDAFPGQAMTELFTHMPAEPLGPTPAQCGLTAQDDREIEDLTARLKAMGYL